MCVCVFSNVISGAGEYLSNYCVSFLSFFVLFCFDNLLGLFIVACNNWSNSLLTFGGF